MQQPEHTSSAGADALALEQRLREDLDRLSGELLHHVATSDVLGDVKAFAAIAAAALVSGATVQAVPWLAPRLALALITAAKALNPGLVVIDTTAAVPQGQAH